MTEREIPERDDEQVDHEVEGHRRVLASGDEGDVEGHRVRRAVPDEDDDVEGHVQPPRDLGIDR